MAHRWRQVIRRLPVILPRLASYSLLVVILDIPAVSFMEYLFLIIFIWFFFCPFNIWFLLRLTLIDLCAFLLLITYVFVHLCQNVGG